jgi:hypothetical protein
LLQVGFAPAAGQGGLEHSELVGEAWTHWSALTRC